LEKRTLSVIVKIVGLGLILSIGFLYSMDFKINGFMATSILIFGFVFLVVADALLEKGSKKVVVIKYTLITTLFVIGIIYSNFYFRLVLLGTLFIVMTLFEKYWDHKENEKE